MDIITGGDFIGLNYDKSILLLLLLAAVLMDFKHDRISNGWLLFGSMIGLYLYGLENGWLKIYMVLPAVLLSFCLLYPIYKIGALGAGDVKLFLMTGCYLTTRQVLEVLVFAFAIGAVFSLGKMYKEDNFVERMEYLFSYFIDLLRTGQWKLYEKELRLNRNKYRHRIHFSLPVCLGVLLGMGGLF